MNPLYKNYKTIKKQIDRSIKEVIKSGQFINGKQINTLEKKVAKYCKVKYALGVANGTDALLLSLMAIGIKKGDEVILPDLSFVSTAEVIVRLGAIPVFVDIDPFTFNIDCKKIRKKITNKTKAIIPVHMYGQTCDMSKIYQLSIWYNLKIVEDACQAFGAEYENNKAGSIGDIGCISFFPTKNLGCYGDGGMIVTNEIKYYNKIKSLRSHGMIRKNIYISIGMNSRLDTIQAAILLEKLKHIDKWNKKRKEIAAIYNKELIKCGTIILPIERNDHTYHQYVIRVINPHTRKRLLDELKLQVHYPIPLHLQPCFSFLENMTENFPVTNKICNQIVSLPIYPELEKKEQYKIIEKIKKIV